MEMKNVQLSRKLNDNKINLGWRRYKVFADIGVYNCFKWCKYHQGAKKCEAKQQICGKCAKGGHSDIDFKRDNLDHVLID